MSKSNPKVGFVSLGCPKALVDSERILTQLRVEGYDIVPTYDKADVVVVNTCGFIDSAVEESLDAIGEAMAENGKVIVTGCLGKRPEQIREQFPDVLSISGPQDYSTVMSAVHAALPPKHDPFIDLVPDYGIKLTPKHYAYLKISEGCTTVAASASFRPCAAIWSRVRWTRCCAKPRSWCVAACRSCWSFHRTPAPTAWICAMPNDPGVKKPTRPA
jgi:hypothetical protein